MPCKPSTLCSSLLPYQKKKVKSCLAHVVEPQHLPRKKNVAVSKSSGRLRTSEASSSSSSRTGVLDGRLTGDDFRPSLSEKSKHKNGENTNKPVRRSSSWVYRDFLSTTAGASYGFFTSLQDLPSCEEALSQFQSTYPRYSETTVLDDLRQQEYAHLEEDDSTTCLDYCGFGLLSQEQQWEVESGSSLSTTAAAFNMIEISANLWSHALFGVPPQGTMEAGLRKRIMQFLNISDAEYSMAFTASRGSTFKLLADAYPWETSGSLITMYDYESESVGWMEQRARERGASVYRARFRWPSLRVSSRELKKELTSGCTKKRKVQQDSGSWLERLSSRHQHQPEKEGVKGLFVYPAQSRVSGAKYSYQWMALAQQNKWHVLLDASALGPKDMDSLGLSLFRPDFITASFYRLFGSDPSGFGCLFIKNSVAQSIQDPSGAPVSGLVRIIPSSVYSAASGSLSLESEEDQDHVISSFSGPMVFSGDFSNGHHLTEIIEENDSSACEDNASVGAISRSPVFSEDGNESVFYTGANPSPLGSVSEQNVNGLIQEPANSHTFSKVLYGKKDIANSCVASRIRLKGLYSGLLQRHAGRVGNSGGITGEEDQIQLPQTPDLSKHPEQKNMGLGIFEEMCSANSEAKDNQIKEHVADRVVMILRKDQSESGDITLGLTIKRCERSMFSNVNGADHLHQGADGTPEERSKVGGLESIAEMEAEFDRSNEEGCLEIDGSLSRGADERQLAEISWNQKENAICRETEGDFRLLGRRNELFSIGKTFSGDSPDGLFLDSVDSRGTETEHNIETRSEEDVSKQAASEPYLLCRSLDHADMLGLNKTSLRLRYLINWLISSMLRLRHVENDLSLVKIYGPQVRYDRGASVAFNLFDNRGKMLHPELVRLLADHANITIGLGFLKNIDFGSCHGNADVHSLCDIDCNGQQQKQMALPARVEVVTAALGLLSDFKDVYKMWVFVAKFLDPDFPSREYVRHQLSGQYSDG